VRQWRRAGLVILSLIPGSALAQGSTPSGDLIPPGYGTLNQDDVNIRLVAGDLEVRFLPLDARVLVLIARDGYQSLHGLVAARQAQIDSAAREAGFGSPGLALVSFFALRDGARFDPPDVNLSYRNQLYRPIAIVPVTANFNSRQLPVRRRATAIYLYEVTLPVFEEFQVTYGATQSDAWRDIRQHVERERDRVVARLRAERGDSLAAKP